LKLKNRYIYLTITLSIILADQISKYFIRSSFGLYDQKNIIKGFFRFIYVKNNGAVWGFFSGNSNPFITILITILAIIALSVVIYLFFKIGSEKILEALALSFIAGGAIGNIIDRIFLGYVVDFIEIYIKKYRWPTFNIADSFISIGIVLLLFSIFKDRKNSEKKKGVE